ncbi:hypothetical protein K488DRAFT_67133 [Vararia minispora EC-137]|uniref:Uncharacterized protein n=1 Tax=Vararia minispora EC-137 TaxID=1314806 RepID=A0ACB8R002_9AGAM|nr:hypothetical protein K488DRAFT_67133 [Vararia minispora EC-137]
MSQNIAQQRTPGSEQPQIGLPPVSTPVFDSDASAPRASASETLGGSTSADLHTGLGKPVGGMTSAELHHDGKAHRKRQGGNVQQYGVQAGAVDDNSRKDNSAKDSNFQDL